MKINKNENAVTLDTKCLNKKIYILFYGCYSPSNY